MISGVSIILWATFFFVSSPFDIAMPVVFVHGFYGWVSPEQPPARYVSEKERKGE